MLNDLIGTFRRNAGRCKVHNDSFVRDDIFRNIVFFGIMCDLRIISIDEYNAILKKLINEAGD